MSRQEEAPIDPTPVTDGGSPQDDVVLPFQTERSGALGRLVRLGPTVDAILARHNYPDPISHVLGEAIALTAMLGSTLKFDGRLILQANTDGPLRLLVVNYETPGHMRAYANYDADLFSADEDAAKLTAADVIGQGHLAMTVDRGEDMDRYQGIVPLEGTTLSDAALTYFRQSEQLPTFIRLAVARQYTSSSQSRADGLSWRSGGLMIQHVASEGGQSGAEDDKKSKEQKTSGEQVEEPAERLIGEDDDHWQRVRILASTVEDHELLDPTLSPERLLYRLFHEEGVRVKKPRIMTAQCRCSREQIAAFLERFDEAEMSNLREPDGAVTVKCEFCSKAYRFEAKELD